MTENERKTMMILADTAKRDTEAVKEFVGSDAFMKLMESLDKQDRAATEDAEQFLRSIKEREDTYNYLLHGAKSLVKEDPKVIEALQDIQKGE